ncbi:hypothetical protein N657DRAFT_132251 [Parathielavia appendiculata]|uniref:Uncharacterized protein n=1 Tax=Parathielavia appendiculata TaxID=2587402 RepID=A0AAN6TUM7_9PEZI|nr:hypothetical protein N657DRAFT_132251 [Parathielavia appendiculata]
MKRGVSHQPFHPDAGLDDHRPARPRHTRSRSQGSDNTRRSNADNGPNSQTIQGVGQSQGSIFRRLTHLRAESYTSHIRSDSRTSWDGTTVPSRTPSPSPSQSPVRRNHRPRPLSVVTLPGHSPVRPAVIADRWSYDRERMPSRPPTPLHVSNDEGTGVASSPRPASTTVTDSGPSSRAESIPLSASTADRLSSPALTLIPPPPPDFGESQEPKGKFRQSCHLLTSEEMEMLSHPPPPPSPMSAKRPLASPSSPPSPPPPGVPPASLKPNQKPVNETSSSPLGAPPHQKGDQLLPVHRRHMVGDLDKDRPGCLGLCEILTAQRIGATFGGWFMGVVMPLATGFVNRCVAAVTSCQ